MAEDSAAEREVAQRADLRRLLAEEQARYTSLFESTAAGLLVTDERGVIIEVNAIAARLLGQQPDALLREPLSGLVHPVGARSVDEELRVAVDQRETRRFDLLVRTGEQSRACVRAHVVPDLGTAHVPRLRWTLVEVTADRDRAEREDAGRDFVMNAAHELRTPLAGITAAVEVLQSGAKEDPVDRDRFLGHIARQSDRLVRLSGALLTLARAETRAEAPPAEIVPLAPILAGLAARAPAAPGVRIAVSCPAELAVLANDALTEQALSTLVDNAAEHTATGSITLAASVENGAVAVTVTDTGSGIAPEVRERVFERFYRGSPTGHGLGLGLSIARAAAENMGGRLELESAPGEGTVARMTLPAARIVSRQ